MSIDPRAAVLVSLPEHDDLLDAFYADVYLPAFRHQREPLEVWKRQLGGERTGPILCISVIGNDLHDRERRRIDGGMVAELYPRSGCGLLTYLVVAPGARRRGVGRALLDRSRELLAERAAARGIELGLVFGEITDPRGKAGDDAEAAWKRLQQFQHWGAHVVDIAYVQPDLGAGLGRDRDLVLLAFFDGDGAPPATIDGSRLVAFLRDLYEATEGQVPTNLAMFEAGGRPVRLLSPDGTW